MEVVYIYRYTGGLEQLFTKNSMHAVFRKVATWNQMKVQAKILVLIAITYPMV